MRTSQGGLLAVLSTLAWYAGARGSNLPPEEPGVFKAEANATIDAPIDAVWHALLDFRAYPDWNPFVRSQVLANDLFFPLEDQSNPQAGQRLIIHVQIPPLTPPVDADTPADPLHAQSSFENITFLEGAPTYRAAWKQIMIPDVLINATRWQVLSTLQDGRTLYEAREVYAGSLASTLESLLGEGLQEAFNAQASELKAYIESA
ncbi:hypothetical protein K525DRAFT_362807 [Schizophyllum commune Loenen D]|nr:hypothetical protein K525DRAFT_362807 [Schizophyllum commune Loenen D]